MSELFFQKAESGERAHPTSLYDAVLDKMEKMAEEIYADKKELLSLKEDTLARLDDLIERAEADVVEAIQDFFPEDIKEVPHGGHFFRIPWFGGKSLFLHLEVD